MFMALDQSVPFESKAEFANRIARIQAGGMHTNRTLFVGNEEALPLPPGGFRRKPRRVRPGLVFLGMVMGCGIVVVAVMASTNLF